MPYVHQFFHFLFTGKLVVCHCVMVKQDVLVLRKSLLYGGCSSTSGVQLPEGFSSLDGSMWMGIVMQQ